MKTTGVYAIRCLANGKVYVGSASRSLAGRWREHLCLLRKGRHHSRHLQAAWGRYGEAAFMFEILEECEADSCIAREQHWIDKLQSARRSCGFNLLPTAGSMLGFKHSDETRKRVADAVRGRRHTPEARNRMSAFAKLRGMPAETLAKAHAARRGKPISDAQKAKQSAALKGRKRSAETIAKMSAALKGRKLDAETCAHFSRCQKGKRHSEATKAKMAATRKGRKHSAAHSLAISQGHRKRAERLRAERHAASALLPFMEDSR